VPEKKNRTIIIEDEGFPDEINKNSTKRRLMETSVNIANFLSSVDWSWQSRPCMFFHFSFNYPLFDLLLKQTCTAANIHKAYCFKNR
jgi:hypothetical protein